VGRRLQVEEVLDFGPVEEGGGVGELLDGGGWDGREDAGLELGDGVGCGFDDADGGMPMRS
jgi:hypothetical protein